MRDGVFKEAAPACGVARKLAGVRRIRVERC
jgi:hypothetical protein